MKLHPDEKHLLSMSKKRTHERLHQKMLHQRRENLVAKFRKRQERFDTKKNTTQQREEKAEAATLRAWEASFDGGASGEGLQSASGEQLDARFGSGREVARTQERDEQVGYADAEEEKRRRRLGKSKHRSDLELLGRREDYWAARKADPQAGRWEKQRLLRTAMDSFIHEVRKN